MKSSYQLRVRKSLAEYVAQELDQQHITVFHQRIYIVAKNRPIGGKDRKMLEFLEREELRERNRTSAGSATTQLRDIPVEQVSTSPTETRASDMNDSSTPSPIATTVEMSKAEKHARKLKELKTFEENPKPAVDNFTEFEEKDFYTLFMERIHELHDYCMERTYTRDPLCGLYLHMGEYSMLVLESCEDMVDIFCRELQKCCEEFWESNRVLQIEDKISVVYFDDLIGRRTVAAQLNEDFPNSMLNDVYLMGKQHLIIKHKIKTICELISRSLSTIDKLAPHDSDSSGEEEGTAMLKLRSVGSILPLDPFRQLLPEVQRLDLVLNATHFYYTLKEFSQLNGSTPLGYDEDNYFWPIPNNYTPSKIFERSAFEINLTFAETNSNTNAVSRHSDEAIIERAAAQEAKYLPTAES